MNRKLKYTLRGLGIGSGAGAATGATTAVVHPDIENTKENIGQSALLGAAVLGLAGAGGGYLESQIMNAGKGNKQKLVRDFIDGKSDLR